MSSHKTQEKRREIVITVMAYKKRDSIHCWHPSIWTWKPRRSVQALEMSEEDPKTVKDDKEDIEFEEVDSYPPWNFSWVVEGRLAAMAWPQKKENLKYIAEEEKIKHLVTVSPEKVPPIDEQNFGLEWTLIPVDEFSTPSVKDIVKFIDICQRCEIKNQAVGIHCRMGRGRTGVLAACYLVKFKDLTPERAITDLRLLRPGSIETPEQERAVIRYFDCVRGTASADIQNIEDDTRDYVSLAIDE